MFATTDAPSTNSLERLESIPPGPELAHALAGMDDYGLSEFDRVTRLRAHARQVAHYQGLVYRDIAGLESEMRGGREAQHHEAVETAAIEVGAALHLTRRSAEAETHLALELTRRLPDVHAALLRGDVDLRRAKALLRGTEHLPDHTARRMVDQVLDKASELTTGQLGARLRRLCMEAEPDDAKRRYNSRVEDRRVELRPNPEGTANLLGFDLPADRVSAISRYLNRAARKLRSVADGRTMDQLRADVMLDILEGAHTPLGAPRGGAVHLEIDLATLAELNDHAGDLAGFGPVTADLARQLAEGLRDAEWSFTITDPETGDIVCDGTTRRRPRRAQRRRIQARHKHCVWPGCRMPSVDCDMDHRVRHADSGCGHDHNLAPLCRFHHRMRHQADWTYRRLATGDIEWTSGTGRVYLTRRWTRAP